MLDPGIDFAKQRDDNLRVVRHLGQLARFRRPVLLPVSRKTVVGDVLGLPDARDRDAGSLGLLVAGAGARVRSTARPSTATATIRRPVTASSPNKQWYVHRRRPRLGGRANAAASSACIPVSE